MALLPVGLAVLGAVVPGLPLGAGPLVGVLMVFSLLWSA